MQLTVLTIGASLLFHSPVSLSVCLSVCVWGAGGEGGGMGVYV